MARFQPATSIDFPSGELVYHDCVVAQWYWGDYNNKLPTLWDRRDLINALYGTPPVFCSTLRYGRRTATRIAQAKVIP